MVSEKPLVKKIGAVLLYFLFLISVFVVADVFLLRKILGFGYPRNYERYPAPYVMFVGWPGSKPNNAHGFWGKDLDEAKEGDLKVAFFGGSTGYMGDPPIPVVVENRLQEMVNVPVFVANFSVISSNHRQHLHMLVEYLLKRKIDVVIFYGGYNETVQHAYYDPRPGYPFNFFFQEEASPWIKILLEYSALAGEIDRKYRGVISGLSEMREHYHPFSTEWNDQIVDTYFETLALAHKIVSTIDSDYLGKAVMLAVYQPYQVPEEFLSSHHIIRRRMAELSYGYDLSNLYDPLGKDVYTDIVHVSQKANDLMGETIAKIIKNRIGERLVKDK